MKLYFQVVIILVLLAVVFGFAGPMLISAKSTEATLAGLILVVVSIPVLATMVGKLVFKKEKKNEEN